MKTAFIALTVFFASSAFAQENSENRQPLNQVLKIQGTLYGKPFDGANSLTADEVVNRAADRELPNIAVTGKIEEVCQSEGCWMRIARSQGPSLLVKFKDHEFFIPKDMAGKDVIFFGKAYSTTLSVKMLRHYAEDAGKPKEEIEKITEPSKGVAFEATGVVIK